MEKRDDGKSVSEVVNELNVPYFNMGDSTELIPLAIEANNPGEKVLEEVNKYFEQYGIKQLKK